MEPSLAPQRRRPAVVLGEQRDHLVGSIARALLDEAAHLEVLPRPHGLGQHPVGHVADQDVLERQLALAGQPALGAGGEDVLLLQRDERLLQLARVGLGQRRQRPFPERAPDDGGLLDDASLERLQRVEPGRQDGLNGVGQLGLAHAALLGDPARHLLGEQRVAARALDQRRKHGLARRQQRRDQLLGLPGAQRVEHQLRGRAAAAAPARAPVEQLVARQADQQQRRAHPLGEVLDRVEHSVVGPVDVLEGDHHRLARGHRLDSGSQRGEERLAQALGVLAGRGQLARDLEADQPADQGGLALGLLLHVCALAAEQVERVLAQLAPRLLGGVGVDDAALLAQHLAQRPEHDPAAVGKAASGPEGGRRGPRAELVLQLAQHARLADAGLANQRDEVRRALELHALEDRLERRQLLAAADERRLARGCRAAGGLLGAHGDRLPGGHGLGFALEVQRLQLVVVDRAGGVAHGALADGHAARAGGALQPGGDVHRVADDGVVLPDRAGQHLAGVDAHAQVELDALGEVLVHLAHGGLHAEAGAHRALLVVLVGDRRAEDRHDVVADVLVHGAAIARDLLAETHQHAVDQRLDGLRVHALRDRRVAGQVGEQDRDLAALLGWPLAGPDGRLVERLAAAHAEARLGRRRGAAAGTALLERRAAGHAEACPGGVLAPAACAAHRPRVLRLFTRAM